MVTEEDVRAKLERMVADIGSQRAVAKTLNCTEPYLSDILNKRRRISDTIAERLGFAPHVRMYQPQEECRA